MGGCQDDNPFGVPITTPPIGGNPKDPKGPRDQILGL